MHCRHQKLPDGQRPTMHQPKMGSPFSTLCPSTPTAGSWSRPSIENKISDFSELCKTHGPRYLAPLYTGEISSFCCPECLPSKVPPPGLRTTSQSSFHFRSLSSGARDENVLCVWKVTLSFIKFTCLREKNKCFCVYQPKGVGAAQPSQPKISLSVTSSQRLIQTLDP